MIIKNNYYKNNNNNKNNSLILSLTYLPNTLQLYFSNTPFLYNSMPTFNAVCPPIDTMIPSGLSLAIISSTTWNSVINCECYCLKC